MINIDNKYDIGQTVYLITDKEQSPRIVYGIVVSKADLLYKLCCGTQTSEHYDFEISVDKDVLITIE